MTHKIQDITAEVAKPATLTQPADEPRIWLQQQAFAHDPMYLLAHADDGVIWGKMTDSTLILSSDVAPTISPPLRWVTLQTARLFAPAGELLLWRDPDRGWRTRLIRAAQQDESPTWTQALGETQILWGTDAKPLGTSGFSLMRDGAQGLCHAVPLEFTGQFTDQTRPLRLKVRHYVEENAHGVARIVASRLYDLYKELP